MKSAWPVVPGFILLLLSLACAAHALLLFLARLSFRGLFLPYLLPLLKFVFAIHTHLWPRRTRVNTRRTTRPRSCSQYPAGSPTYTLDAFTCSGNALYSPGLGQSSRTSVLCFCFAILLSCLPFLISVCTAVSVYALLRVPWPNGYSMRPSARSHPAFLAKPLKT